MHEWTNASERPSLSKAETGVKCRSRKWWKIDAHQKLMRPCVATPSVNAWLTRGWRASIIDALLCVAAPSSFSETRHFSSVLKGINSSLTFETQQWVFCLPFLLTIEWCQTNMWITALGAVWSMVASGCPAWQAKFPMHLSPLVLAAPRFKNCVKAGLALLRLQDSSNELTEPEVLISVGAPVLCLSEVSTAFTLSLQIAHGTFWVSFRVFCRIGGTKGSWILSTSLEELKLFSKTMGPKLPRTKDHSRSFSSFPEYEFDFEYKPAKEIFSRTHCSPMFVRVSPTSEPPLPHFLRVLRHRIKGTAKFWQTWFYKQKIFRTSPDCTQCCYIIQIYTSDRQTNHKLKEERILIRADPPNNRKVCFGKGTRAGQGQHQIELFHKEKARSETSSHSKMKCVSLHEWQGINWCA